MPCIKQIYLTVIIKELAFHLSFELFSFEI